MTDRELERHSPVPRASDPPLRGATSRNVFVSSVPLVASYVFVVSS